MVSKYTLYGFLAVDSIRKLDLKSEQALVCKPSGRGLTPVMAQFESYTIVKPLVRISGPIYWSERSAFTALAGWRKRRWPL